MHAEITAAQSNYAAFQTVEKIFSGSQLSRTQQIGVQLRQQN